MIPKVATNLLHFSAQRVAAAVQTTAQTITPSFRSALQFQSQQATSNVGVNAANAGLGAGGATSNAASAKFNAGGRFYNAYQHATQDPSFAATQQDDEDEDNRRPRPIKTSRKAGHSRPIQKHHHARSSSNSQLALRNPGLAGAISSSAISPSSSVVAHARLLHSKSYHVSTREKAQRKMIEQEEHVREYATSPTSAENAPESPSGLESAGSSAGSQHQSPKITTEAGVAGTEPSSSKARSFVDPAEEIDALSQDTFDSYPEAFNYATVSTDPSSPQSVLPPIPSAHNQRGNQHPSLVAIVDLVRTSRPGYQSPSIPQEDPVIPDGTGKNKSIGLTHEFVGLSGEQRRQLLQQHIKVLKRDGVIDSFTWSHALWATIVLRKPGDSLKDAIGLYNELLSGEMTSAARDLSSRSAAAKGKGREEVVIVPSERVISLLIKALATRDAEVRANLEALGQWEAAFGPYHEEYPDQLNANLDTTTSASTSSPSPSPSPSPSATTTKKGMTNDEAKRLANINYRQEIGSAPENVALLENLKRENNFAPAMALTNATLQHPRPRSLGVMTYNLLLQSALEHAIIRERAKQGEEGSEAPAVGVEVGGIPSAITIFAHLEKSGTRPNGRTFSLLLQIYAEAGDLEGAQEVWNEFRDACARGSIDWILHDESSSPAGQSSTRLAPEGRPSRSRDTVRWEDRAGSVPAHMPLSREAVRSLGSVWTEMMRTCFACGDPTTGLGVLEKMMDSTFATHPPSVQEQEPWHMRTLVPVGVGRITPVDIPPPSAHTYYIVVKSFLEMGDLDTAITWFKRLLEQEVVEERDALTRITQGVSRAELDRVRWDPIDAPPRPSRELWDRVTHALFQLGEVETFNELMDHANTIANAEFERQCKVYFTDPHVTDGDIGLALHEKIQPYMGAYDKRDHIHWTLAWRSNVMALEQPKVSQEKKNQYLDWMRTRVVDRVLYDAEAPIKVIRGFINGEKASESMYKIPLLMPSFKLTSQVGRGIRDKAWHAVGLYISNNRMDDGILLANKLYDISHKEITEEEQAALRRAKTTKAVQGEERAEEAETSAGSEALSKLSELRTLVSSLEERIWTYGAETKTYPSIPGLLVFLQLIQRAGVMPAMRSAWYLVNAFLTQKDAVDLSAFTPADWSNLARTFAATSMSVFYEDNRPAPNPEMAWQLITFLRILQEQGKGWDDIGRHNTLRIYKILQHHLGQKESEKLFNELGSAFQSPERFLPTFVKRSGAANIAPEDMTKGNKILDVQKSVDEARARARKAQGEDSFQTHPLVITPAQNAYIFEGARQRMDSPHIGGGVVSPEVGYERLVAGFRRGEVPSPENVARLITNLGHNKLREKVIRAYEIGNEILASLESNKSWQASGWVALEDAMVTALAHCGDLNASSIHRSRLVAQGSAPTASAYGAMIANIKDTTDNASVATELFEESRRLGVQPNAYLFNTIISRLAKARKADYAMMLFQEMKGLGLQPTEVTYGAVIAGCARIGDAHTAELLFEEMRSLNGYRPRIPPFNTMMQLYTHVKPNRERAMHYFNLMQRLGVEPTPYTYKLMLDVYGKIEPVDIPRMEEIIQSMKNRRMDVTGNHYSSLITAKGCATHDLDGALQVFEGLRKLKKPVRSSLFHGAASAPLPDVLAYEALLSVVVTHHRIDLMQRYFDTMINVDRVRPTAYIYNLLIKGYAAGGQIDRAREIFEQMKDPQAGAAAPNNHLPHAYMGNESRPPAIREMNGRVDGSVEDPVYREPSSWEAMVRAELSVGDRERAGALLERMRARFYPAAVTAKIEGILWEPNGIQKSPTDSA